MKRALIYSLLLHALLLALSVFFIPLKKTESPQPFYARIITPEELQEERKPAPPKPPARPEKKTVMMPPKLPRQPKSERFFVPPKLPKDAPAPKEMSATPKQQGEGGQDESPKRESPGRDSKAAKSSSEEKTPAAGQKESALPGGKEGPGQGKSLSSKTLKEKLFDKDVLSMLSHDGQAAKKLASGGITINLSDSKYYGYAEMFWSKFVHEWHEPPAYERGRNFGEVLVRIVIRKNGSLRSVDVVQTSGHPSLDQETTRIIQAMGPFWPLPDSWNQDTLEFEVNISYPYFDPRYQTQMQRYLERRAR